MQITSFFVALALAVSSVSGLPTAAVNGRGIFDGTVGATDDLLIFDSPGFPDPANPGNTLISLQTFVSLRQVDLGLVTKAITEAISALGVEVGDSLNILQGRIKLIGAIGLPGKSTTVTVPGCTEPAAKSGSTSGSDLGMSLKTVSLGQCASNVKEFTATSSFGGFLNDRTSQATVFNSPNSGFGVISDIDDTIKISNVLDTVALIKSTLLEAPKPVAGMPELYGKLAQSLNQPQFVYVTGSPFQLYPFLNDFIDTTYSASKGPIFAQNLTIVDPVEAIKFVSNGNTEGFKNAQIDRLRVMYLNKKWLAIGDSTQKDPEVYGASFKRHGDAIACSWIRRVEGANNTDERFAAAFAGVPANKFRIYTDADIPSLANINVAAGEC
ncbi:hypothetical protein M413DRAFT_19017 [Hebeloma cylindrosporum]|uniref:Phosphatidate phosphatase APP1 catalytic domain-containing protein n=1 Tax=Hebeloma cylindrosporum TaxID=76867 RepID=A0A0C2YKS4_HEBCY|nr:hypothetical protein M413DRAFT_19017 [Hebeloma cylindrosporum h7]